MLRPRLPRVLFSAFFLLLGVCLTGAAQAQNLSRLTVSSAGPTGGDYVTGTVTLDAAAPANGLTFTLTSNHPGAASVPATVTVSAGQTQGTFGVTTTPVSAATAVTLSATGGGTTKTAALTVYPPQALWFWVSPNPLIGGGPTTGTIVLDGPAPTGGWTLSVTSSNTLAAVAPNQDTPASPIVVPAGATSVNFPIRTSTVNYPTIVTLTEQANGLSADISLQPTNLHVIGLLPPNIVQLAWDPQQTTHYYLYRAVYPPTSTGDWTRIAALDSSVLTYNDAFDFVPGTPYIYALVGDMGVRYSADIVQPFFVKTTGNQAADSRLDLRYSTNVFLDHSFGGTAFRGGLFAGLASDPARVGRSFAKFPLDSQPAHTLPFFRVGSIAAFLTKAYSAGTSPTVMQVACQVLADSSWDAGAMKWSTAPAADPNAAKSFATVQYDPSAPVSQWLTWSIGDAMKLAIVNQTPLSVALMGRNESQNGWAYFAKQEYDPTKGPTACYAWCGPVVLALTFNPSTVAPGGTTTGTISLNGVGPSDSAPVYIWNDAGYGLAPHYRIVTVTGMNRTFQIAVGATATASQVWFHASLFPPNTYPDSTYFYWYASALLTVSTGGGDPGGGGTPPGGGGPPAGGGGIPAGPGG